jgi:folate-binding protein YgfZ
VSPEPKEHAAKEHFGNPTIEQRNLAAGTAAVDLGARGIITVTGPDRLEWLHSLLSQNLKNLLPGISAEALLLDPQGHIEHVIHFLDDGESSWMVVEAEGREGFLAWLNKMIFRMKVEVADRSADFAVIGHIGDGIPHSMQRPAKWQWTESLIEVGKVSAVLAEYEQAGTMAYDALRVAAHRPRQLTEVDAKALPHEFDWMSTAVHMSKGCYRGQETVAKVHNLGHPPRRLTFLHLDGSGHFLPSAGDEVFVVGENGVVEDRPRGNVTIAAQHFESGPIALALLSRSVPEDAALIVRGDSGEIDASQEVIVPASAGKAADLPKRNLLMGGKH